MASAIDRLFTQFNGIVEAARVVSERLTFLAGLKLLLFDPHFRRHLKERSQLHRILVHELWVFADRLRNRPLVTLPIRSAT